MVTPFSVASIHTIAGQCLAVLLIVQFMKNLPRIKAVPTQLLAFVVGECIVFLTSALPSSILEGAILFLNGLLVTSSAVGGWHLLSTTLQTETSLTNREGSQNSQ